MAKFNITVDLDWLEEDGSIDQTIQDEIMASISSKVLAKVRADIQTKVDNQVNNQVEAVVNEKLNTLLEDFFTRPRTITDQWGDKVKADISVVELLKLRCDEFLDGEVDRDGKAIKRGSYSEGQSRIDYIISKHIDCNLKSAVERAAKEVKEGIDKFVKESLREHIGDNVVEALGIDKLFKKS